jgi:hypothetical protein
MQPYFLPYLGYFQLIDSVDTYVNLDHVSFMKRSFMTRNNLKNNTKINLNVYSSSQNKSCCDVMVNFENDYINKFKTKLHHLYSKSKNYNLINDSIINQCFIGERISISKFNFKLIKEISKYLEINTKFIETSDNLTDNKKGDGLIDITKKLNGTTYINAIGGNKLYEKSVFKKEGIDLFFIKMSETKFENPYVSILDLLYTYPKEEIITELKKYSLV